MLAKRRWAFCIDYNHDEQIVYRGFFGLKCVDRKTFVGFARITDVFDYMERSLTTEEIKKLKYAYRASGFMKTCIAVSDLIDKLFRTIGIVLFVNPEGGGIVNDTETK
jgi:hypothetical protein